MHGRMHRTQILFEPEQHRALAEIAMQEGRSISDVVREIVRRELEKRNLEEDAELEEFLEGIERIRQRRNEILERRGGKPIDIDVVELIDRMREEPDADIVHAGNDPGD